MNPSHMITRHPCLVSRGTVTGLHESDTWAVINRLCIHRVHDAHIIGYFCSIGQKFADPLSALTVLRKFEGEPTNGRLA